MTAQGCLQACSPKQVMQDVAHAEGRRLRTQADADRRWRHLLSPRPPAAPLDHDAGGHAAAAWTNPGAGPEGAVDAGAESCGGEGVLEEHGATANGRGRPRGWTAHAVNLPPRRELSPPRRTATPQPLPQALIDVAAAHSGFATTMRAAGAGTSAGLPVVLKSGSVSF